MNGIMRLSTIVTLKTNLATTVASLQEKSIALARAKKDAAGATTPEEHRRLNSVVDSQRAVHDSDAKQVETLERQMQSVSLGLTKNGVYAMLLDPTAKPIARLQAVGQAGGFVLYDAPEDAASVPTEAAVPFRAAWGDAGASTKVTSLKLIVAGEPDVRLIFPVNTPEPFVVAAEKIVRRIVASE
jgi:hypothetical protein